MSEWKQLWLQYHPVADKGFAAYAERVVLEGFEESGVIGSVREELTRGLSGMLGKEPVFVKEAEEAGFVNLKGHRTVGGMRASIYNAMPKEGVEKLVEFMKKFEEENA